MRSAALARLEQLARDRNIAIEHETRANHFAFDGAQGEIFWPQRSAANSSTAAKNDDSLVLRLRYQERAILLSGDAEKEAESEMLAENSEDELQAEVLKIGHHGGRNSTTPDFLAAVKPRLGIISVGEDNAYGHPHAGSCWSGSRNVPAFAFCGRSDRDGAVHILIDGKGLEVKCFFVPCLPPVAWMDLRAQAPDHDKDDEQQ